MDRSALSRRLKERGVELGLKMVGIAPADPSAYGTVLDRWIASGHAGTMTWMDRTAGTRVDPRSRFPWLRSIVVGSLSYLPYEGDRGSQSGLVPYVARYAVGRDYHDLLGERMRSLAATLEREAPGARTHVYVDTGPLLERELAVRAGLGWFGKSTNLIAPRGDSWILLGQILTDVDLPGDEPVTDHCGTCTACIDDCPTGAILEPYLVDSTRCISYLTIELRDGIDRAQRGDLGDWLFGCDVCQEVCPWNRKVKPTSDVGLLPGAHLSEESLAGIVRSDARGVRERFRGTPLDRPRRRGLVRNALIVAANTGNGEAIEAAEDALGDEEPVIRGTAAWTLGRAGGRRRRDMLERARARESDPGVVTEIDAALEEG